MAEPTCATHPDAAAAGSCQSCLRTVCSICLVLDRSRLLCVACARKAQRTRTVMMAVGAVVAVGAVGFVATRPRPPAPPAAAGAGPASFASSDYARTIEILEERLAKEPCDRQQMLSLDEALTKAGDNRAVVSKTEEFWKRCGPLPRLRWYTYGAHKTLSELDKAIVDATELIKDNPNDKDFWWWRGIAYQETGQLEKAAADFLQTISIQPRITGIPFNLASVYEKLDRPCEAIYPIEQFLRYYPDVQDRASVDRRLLRLYGDPRCASLTGTGRAVVRFRPGDPIIHSAVRIAGTVATFVVDTGASYTAISSKLAEKLGVKVVSRIRVHTAGGIVEGGLSSLADIQVQGARAQNVPTVVLESFPPGIDGLLGLSFLARFDLQMESTTGKLTISARKP